MRYPRCAVTSEIFAGEIERDDHLLEIVNRLCGMGYYERIGVGLMYDENIARKVRNMTERSGVKLLLWIVHQMNGEGLDISSPDSSLRTKSLRRVMEFVDMAAASGADCLGMCSGPNPENNDRKIAFQCLEDSLVQIHERLKQYNMSLLVEPLDSGAHKNKLLGTTQDTLELIRVLEGHGINLDIVWDTAHVALNGDDLFASQEKLHEHISHYHLANAVLDTSSNLFGDWHMPYGKPGFLTTEYANELLRAFANLPSGHKTYLSVETRPAKGMDVWENERLSRVLMDTIDP